VFRSIKESLVEVLGEEKLKTALEKGNISNLWKECVGPTIGENTTIRNFKNGILTIKTKTSVWRNELLFQKTDIIKKINLKLDKNKIKDIRFL
jgi:predicted nucleic acid-binding Zn ribbon protein